MQAGSELSGRLGRDELQLGYFNDDFYPMSREIMQGRRST